MIHNFLCFNCKKVRVVPLIIKLHCASFVNLCWRYQPDLCCTVKGWLDPLQSADCSAESSFLCDGCSILSNRACLLYVINSHMPTRDNRKCWMSPIDSLEASISYLIQSFLQFCGTSICNMLLCHFQALQSVYLLTLT